MKKQLLVAIIAAVALAPIPSFASGYWAPSSWFCAAFGFACPMPSIANNRVMIGEDFWFWPFPLIVNN